LSRKIAKALIALVLTLCLIEGLVRVTDVDRRRIGDPFAQAEWAMRYLVPDPYLLWRGRPGMPLIYSTEVVNSRGLRGVEVPRRKAPGVKRVAVLGDSCTFGIITERLDMHATPRPYAALLGDLLARNLGPGKVEVINYGMIGYTTHHGLRMLRREALPDHPDFVVIRFGWNDHLSSPVNHPFSNPRHTWEEVLLDLAYRSRLLGMLLYRGIPMRTPTSRAWSSSAHPITWVTPEDYAWNLSRMIDLARSHGAQPILLDAPAGPITPQMRKRKEFFTLSGYATPEQFLAAHARYQAIAARVAAEKKVPLIRTADKLEGNEAYYSSIDPAHPNAAGHAVIAERLYVWMLEPLMRGGVLGEP